MHLLNHAVSVVPAATTSPQKEDPFSAMASQLLEGMLQNLFCERGQDTRVAIAFANCFGGWTFGEAQLRRIIEDGPSRVSPFQSVAWFPAAAQGRVTIKYQLRVPALTFSTESLAFYDALAACQFWLARDVCDIALAGAAESVGSRFLASAIGSRPTSDAAVWFALSSEGQEVIELHDHAPPHMKAIELKGDDICGSPIRGSCALPLLILGARRYPYCTFRLKGRTLIRAERNRLILWRLDDIADSSNAPELHQELRDC